MSLDYQLPHSALALAPLDTVSQDLLEYVPSSPSPPSLVLTPPFHIPLPPVPRSLFLLIERLPTTTTTMLI